MSSLLSRLQGLGLRAQGPYDFVFKMWASRASGEAKLSFFAKVRVMRGELEETRYLHLTNDHGGRIYPQCTRSTSEILYLQKKQRFRNGSGGLCNWAICGSWIAEFPFLFSKPLTLSPKYHRLGRISPKYKPFRPNAYLLSQDLTTSICVKNPWPRTLLCGGGRGFLVEDVVVGSWGLSGFRIEGCSGSLGFRVQLVGVEGSAIKGFHTAAIYQP